MSNQNNFDFKAFSNLTDRIPAGLQVFLAQQLMSNALWSYEKFDNPRATQVRGIFADIKGLRVDLKNDAAARETKSGDADIDNGTK
jgi:hypothetical protein